MTVRRVPLFPLSTVLFPNMVLSLHIFEPRYRELVNRCADQDIPFGVLLIKDGPGPRSVVEPYEIGTMARITDVERLEGGRLNVLTVGVNRFRLHGMGLSESYLTGDIEFLEEAVGDPDEEARLARRVRGLFQRYAQHYLQLAQDAAGEAEEGEEADEEDEAESDDEAGDALEEALRAELQADSHDGPDLTLYADRPGLPRHPGALSYAVAAIASWTGREKQELLEFSAASRRLEGEIQLLRRDIASMLALQRLRRLGGRPPFIGPCSSN
ncbi:MAG: LON peptidase substrate-binding domain-containing protein [Symbiobacteriia bacterium]